MSKNNYMAFKKHQKGVAALYLTIIIFSIILAVFFGINAIVLSQLKTVQDIGNSVVAFYAADAGIERALFEDKRVIADSLNNGSSYKVEAVSPCKGDFCVLSLGSYKNTKRAIEIRR